MDQIFRCLIFTYIPACHDEWSTNKSGLQLLAKKLHESAIGILEVGILSASNLVAMKDKEGRLTDPYCVAKYGKKWVRTCTLLNTLAPHWNEHYSWDVLDPGTFITIAVFDDCHLSYSGSDAKDKRIGKVRIHLSTLETNREYTHCYPLMVFTSSGMEKTGELHMSVRFTCTRWANMLAMYGKPRLPKMYYTNPISLVQLVLLNFQTRQMVARRLGRVEQPLRKEVVEYMLDMGFHLFSMRHSKVNCNRLSDVIAVTKWFDDICKWKNPATTILVHLLFLILLCYPELVLPILFMCLFVIGAWNYRRRVQNPLYMDTVLSLAEQADPDELAEEFDTFPTSRPDDIVRMRYDRLRSLAEKVQTVMGDLATLGERAQSLVSWRDPRMTAIFLMFSLAAAVVLYMTPFRMVVMVVGLYLLRHPLLGSNLAFNFYSRLPSNDDVMLN